MTWAGNDLIKAIEQYFQETQLRNQSGSNFKCVMIWQIMSDY